MYDKFLIACHSVYFEQLEKALQTLVENPRFTMARSVKLVKDLAMLEPQIESSDVIVICAPESPNYFYWQRLAAVQETHLDKEILVVTDWADGPGEYMQFPPKRPIRPDELIFTIRGMAHGGGRFPSLYSMICPLNYRNFHEHYPTVSFSSIARKVTRLNQWLKTLPANLRMQFLHLMIRRFRASSAHAQEFVELMGNEIERILGRQLIVTSGAEGLGPLKIWYSLEEGTNWTTKWGLLCTIKGNSPEQTNELTQGFWAHTEIQPMPLKKGKEPLVVPMAVFSREDYAPI